jgi:hypothetical protein
MLRQLGDKSFVLAKRTVIAILFVTISNGIVKAIHFELLILFRR